MPKNACTVKSQEKPRAIIIASKNLGIEMLTNLCTRDVAAGVIQLAGRRTLVASVYLDITEQPVTEWAREYYLICG